MGILYGILSIIMDAQRPKLLVVDDEIDICTFVQRYFGKRGFIVSTTGNGIEALTMIEASKPDLVILDLTLDYAMSGVEVLKSLREHDKDTKVIVISGNTDPKVIDGLYEIGIMGFYAKPIKLDIIAKVVYDTLGIDFEKAEGEAGGSRKTLITEVSTAGSTHQLSNKLNIIRGDCEEFLLDYEDGYLKNKTRSELLKSTVNIIQNVGENIKGFLGSYEEGVLKEKTSEEFFKMNLEILKKVVKTVDGTMEIVDQDKIKESGGKEKE